MLETESTQTPFRTGHSPVIQNAPGFKKDATPRTWETHSPATNPHRFAKGDKASAPNLKVGRNAATPT